MAAMSQTQLAIESMAGVRSLLVPVNGTAVTLGALSLATRLAQANKGKIFAIYVIEVARHLPLEAELPDEIERSEQIFGQAREILRNVTAPSSSLFSRQGTRERQSSTKP